MRQQDKPWEKVGMTRATWYRRGKPTEPRKPPNTANMRTVADQAKTLGASSTRSFQRMMRVLGSELAGYVHAGQLSISQVDRILSSPEKMRRYHEMVAEAKAKPKPSDGDDGIS
jgi:hypothetical protein